MLVPTARMAGLGWKIPLKNLAFLVALGMVGVAGALLLRLAPSLRSEAGAPADPAALQVSTAGVHAPGGMQAPAGANSPSGEPASAGAHAPTEPLPAAQAQPGYQGKFPLWSKIEIVLPGPASAGMSADANPFALEVQVTFTGPDGQRFVVPAFYDGDGAGGMDGNLWKARFSPNAAGPWRFSVASPEALLEGQSGAFEVAPAEECRPYTPGGLPDFSCVGRLEHVGARYLKFTNGPYWLKGGANEPEDFLAPEQNAGFASKEQAIDFLAEKGVNSLYLLLHNVDGDDQNVWPWLGATALEARTNHERFDLARLARWEQIFTDLQEKGIVLHLVLEDDSAWNGFDRALYYREMVARFGHHNGLIWNLAEEYNETYSPDQAKEFAQLLRRLDPYDHPITIHQAGLLRNWEPFLGDANFDLTSLQTDASPQNQNAAAWFGLVEKSGRLIPLSFDETGQFEPGERDLVRHVLWSVYFGGANYELFTRLESGYPAFADYLEDMQRARAFVERLPFWEMRPMNELLVRGKGYVFARPEDTYAVYLPQGGSLALDLSQASGSLQALWFDPRSGEVTAAGAILGGEVRRFSAPGEGDWVLQLSLGDFAGPENPCARPSIEIDPPMGSGPVPDLKSMYAFLVYLPGIQQCLGEW